MGVWLRIRTNRLFPAILKSNMPQNDGRRRCQRKSLTCVAIGVVLTPITAALAVISGGAGHGDYLFARLFFPYTMLLTRLTGDVITVPLVLLALAQFPVYGAILGAASSQPSATGIILFVVISHLVAAGLCFSGALPNFSKSHVIQKLR